MKYNTSALLIVFGLAACSDKAADSLSASDTSEPSMTKVDEVKVDVEAPTPVQVFSKEFDLQGVHFVVQATDTGVLKTLTITPSGLSVVNDVITREIDGMVTNAEVADINADGSPEIYVWTSSEGSDGHVTPIGYSANNKKSLSEIYFPPVKDDAVNSKGYRGKNEFAVLEGVVAQRFPIYSEDSSNPQPTGKIRQLQYKLTQGEASWIMKLDQVTEF